MIQHSLRIGELVVDNFAGGGGASTGIEKGIGRPVDLAINHDPEAIAMHEANHPETDHFCGSVWDVDPDKITKGAPVGLAWFSPDCKHFSKAKGGKPVSPRVRGLAWIVLRWASKVKPRVIMLENVEEFQTWGPIKDGQPCIDRKGQTFRQWIGHLQALGYRVEYRQLKACDYGAPTIRKRLFIIARRDGLPIVWPKPTHGDGLLPYNTAADCIDWSLPCPSIFERKRPLAENTLKRIARGLERFVINDQDPFIVIGNHGGDHFRGQGINEPMQTITAARDHRCLVSPFIAPIANYSGAPRVNSISEPLTTVTASPKGGHHALVTAFLAQHCRGSGGTDMESPTPTIMTRGKTSLVTSHLMQLRGSAKDGRRIDKPLPTITAGGLHQAEVRAFLIQYFGSSGKISLADPLPVAGTRDRFGLAMIHGTPYQIVDIGMRMLSPRELFRAQGFSDDYVIDPIGPNGKPLNKTAQTRMCGNSVCPPLSESLVRANFAHEQIQRRAA